LETGWGFSFERGSKVQKVVLNKSFGGFRLSEKAINRLHDLGHEKIVELKEKHNVDTISKMSSMLKRNDLKLVQVVEELGEEASTDKSKLVIETIPLNAFFLRNYDGMEHVAVMKDKH
jgi:hypothetical protein